MTDQPVLNYSTPPGPTADALAHRRRWQLLFKAFATLVACWSIGSCMLIQESIHDLGPHPNPRTTKNFAEIALALALLAAGLLAFLNYWIAFTNQRRPK